MIEYFITVLDYMRKTKLYIKISDCLAPVHRASAKFAGLLFVSGSS